MEQFQTFEQYKTVLGQAKEKNYRNSNCFFLPATVKQKIAEGKLFYEWADNGLLLFDDCTDFYRCYYCLHDLANPEPLQLDRDAVIEFPYNESLTEKQKREIGQISMLGFHLGRESGLMTAIPEQIVRQEPEHQRGLVSKAVQADAEQVLELIHRSFDPLFAFIPDWDEMAIAISDGRVFVIRNSERAVIATLHSGFEKGIAIIHHVAVAPNARGNGYGKALIKAYHDNYIGRTSRFQHWVDLHNRVAVNIYLGLGYEFGVRKANEYVLKMATKEN